MSAPRRIGVLGGTFDPIHIGHLAAAEDAAWSLSLDRVLFVPNRQPPHKVGQPVTDTADRVAMVALAIAENPLFELSRIELGRPGPSYTLDTLRELQTHLPGAELYFLVGCDALSELHTWHEPRRILNEFHVVMMDRPTGQAADWSTAERHFPDIRRRMQVIHVAQLEISSRDIRWRVREGRPIRYQVTLPVESYIRDRGLYRDRDAPGPVSAHAG